MVNEQFVMKKQVKQLYYKQENNSQLCIVSFGIALVSRPGQSVCEFFIEEVRSGLSKVRSLVCSGFGK